MLTPKLSAPPHLLAALPAPADCSEDVALPAWLLSVAPHGGEAGGQVGGPARGGQGQGGPGGARVLHLVVVVVVVVVVVGRLFPHILVCEGKASEYISKFNSFQKTMMPCYL